MTYVIIVFIMTCASCVVTKACLKYKNESAMMTYEIAVTSFVASFVLQTVCVFVIIAVLR